MRAALGLGAVFLAAAASWGGMNDGLRPHVRAVEPVDGAGKVSPYVEVHVGASGVSSVQAVHVEVEYDPAGLEFVEYRSGDLFPDPFVLGAFDRTERHVVDVMTATLKGPVSASEAEVGVLRFRVLDGDRAGVRVVTFETADGHWDLETQVSYAHPLASSAVPVMTRLWGNTPNPFNPETEIRFSLSERSPVRVEVYNVSGQRVRTLVAGELGAGAHAVRWDGRDTDGSSVSSGVYFYRLQAGSYTESKRMTLIR